MMIATAMFTTAHTFALAAPLFDVGHLLVPLVPDYDVPDFFAAAFVVGFFFWALLAHGPHDAGRALRWYTACYGASYAFRAVAIVSTVLPDPDGRCLERAISNEAMTNYILGPAKTILQLADGRVCGDLLFSGHTVGATLALLFTTWFPSQRLGFFHRHRRAVSFGFLTEALTLEMLLVATRTHYTVDIWIATVIAGLVFSVAMLLPHAAATLHPDHALARFVAYMDGDMLLGRHRSPEPEGKGDTNSDA
jgi:hypothetical protein